MDNGINRRIVVFENNFLTYMNIEMELYCDYSHISISYI